MAPSERGKRNVLADWDVAYKIKETVQKLKFWTGLQHNAGVFYSVMSYCPSL